MVFVYCALTDSLRCSWSFPYPSAKQSLLLAQQEVAGLPDRASTNFEFDVVTSLGEENEQPPLWEMFTILHQLICAHHDTRDFGTSVPN